MNIAELNETKSTNDHEANQTKILINRLLLNHTYEVTVLAWTIAAFGNKTAVYFTMGILFFIKYTYIRQLRARETDRHRQRQRDRQRHRHRHRERQRQRQRESFQNYSTFLGNVIVYLR